MEKKPVFVAENKLNQKGLFAGKNFKDKETVLDLKGAVTNDPTKYSIEVGENEHISDEFGTFLNHSCEPNTAIDRENRKVKASRDISEGEELSFDYNSNESDMATPFDCACGSENCQKVIRGRKYVKENK